MAGYNYSMNPFAFDTMLTNLFTEEEVVNHILIPSTNIDQRKVTNVQLELFDVFDREKSAIDFRSIKDNLKRIRALRGRCFDKLKEILDKELFATRGWINLLSKNEVISDLLRKRGNGYFMKRDLDMALRAYTLAGMYAPKNSKSLAISYSNRSACFAEIHNWRKCLEDIKKFEEIWNKIEEGPTPTGDKVVKRKEKCLKEIGDDEEEISPEKQFGNDFFKLKNPCAGLPFLEDFLGVKTDPKKGRGIYNISDKVIEPGTALIVDEPYSHVYFEPFGFQTNNCSVCYRILDGSGIPCEGCVFNLHCSEACATSDRYNLHRRYECKMAPYLFEVLPKKLYNIHLALSILLKLGPKAFLDHYRQVANKKYNKEEDKAGEDFESYLPIYNLICHEEILHEEHILMFSMYAVILTEVLDSCTDYFTSLKLDDTEVKLIKEEFARRLLLHQMSLPVNSNTIGYLDLPKGRPPTPEELNPVKTICLGVGIYPVVSLVNHSCAPNAVWFFGPEGVMTVMARQHIVSGEEILACYGLLYFTGVRGQRRFGLEKGFGFKCECVACTDNWPKLGVSNALNQQLGIECICPDCRMKVEVFNEILLEYVPLGDVHVCLRKCGFKILDADIETSFSSILDLCEASIMSLNENRFLEGFRNAQKCVRYFDAHFPKPCDYIVMSILQMELPMLIIARKMFD